MKCKLTRSIICIMESLVTQTGILPIPWILTWITLQVVTIGAENLDPVEFTFSANVPKNKSLIPLPKHFDKFGDAQNDCCTLLLFFEVKDLNMQGSGMDPPKLQGAQAQTGTGKATFNFEHPDIRDTDIVFTMDVAMDKDLVKSRHILNFDNCSSIIHKTFNIFATTSITDEKDVRVVLVNGKEVDMKCQDPTPIKPIVIVSTLIPFSNTYSKTNEIRPVPADNSVLTISLGIVASVTSLVAFACIVALAYFFKRYGPEIAKNAKNESIKMKNRNKNGEEKCIPGGDDSEDDNSDLEEKGRGGNGSIHEQRTKVKKILALLVCCVLIAIISVAVIFTA